jgi:hypothetical protein
LMLEYERLVAVICLVFGVDFVWSQILENRMTFSTCSGNYSMQIISYQLSPKLTFLYRCFSWVFKIQEEQICKLC